MAKIAAQSVSWSVPHNPDVWDIPVTPQMREAGAKCVDNINGYGDKAVVGAVCEGIFRAMYAEQPPVQNELTLAWQEGNKAAWKQAERDIAAARQERDAYACEVNLWRGCDQTGFLSESWHWMAEFTDPVTDGWNPPVDAKEQALANALRPHTGDRRMIGR